MKFPEINNCFCPLLSIGQDVAIECQSNCAWFNPKTLTCDISILPSKIIKDPDLMDAIEATK